MTEHDRNATTGAGAMFLSAAIFAFFGWYVFTSQQSLLLFDLVVWSVRGGAIGFAVAGLMALVRAPGAFAVYLLVSVVTVVMFAITGVWHLVDASVPNMNGVLLLVFAAWNGYGAWGELSSFFGRRSVGEESDR